jgi:hypothetical protein
MTCDKILNLVLLRAMLAVVIVMFVPDVNGHAGHADVERPPDGLGASATFDAAGVLWTVAKGGNHVVLRTSPDLGKTWSWGKAVNLAPEPIDAEGNARPNIAVGAKGEVYVSWTSPAADAKSAQIRFARSLDRGQSFSAPITVHADRQAASRRFDTLALGRDGTVFVAWVTKHHARPARAANHEASVEFAVSRDGGASFSGDFKLSERSCECCSISMQAREDGVTALWRHVFATNVRDHAIATIRADGRVDGIRRASVDTWPVNTCPQVRSSMAEDATGRLHAVWFTHGPKRKGALYGQLSESGATLVRSLGSKSATHPDVAVLGNRIAVAWQDFDGLRSRLSVALSADGGSTWRELETAVVDGGSDQPRLLTHQGRFYVFWNTRAAPLSIHALP